MQSWVWECGLETSSQAEALPDGFLLHQQLDEFKEEQVGLLYPRFPIYGFLPQSAV